MISTESQHNENQHALVLEDNEYKTKTRDDVVENLKKLSSQLAGLKHEKTLLEESLEQSIQRVVDLESQVMALTNKHQDYLLKSFGALDEAYLQISMLTEEKRLLQETLSQEYYKQIAEMDCQAKNLEEQLASLTKKCTGPTVECNTNIAQSERIIVLQEEVAAITDKYHILFSDNVEPIRSRDEAFSQITKLTTEKILLGESAIINSLEHITKLDRQTEETEELSHHVTHLENQSLAENNASLSLEYNSEKERAPNRERKNATIVY